MEINNAGIAIPRAVEDLSCRDLGEHFAVNVFGLQELTNTIFPLFEIKGGAESTPIFFFGQ